MNENPKMKDFGKFCQTVYDFMDVATRSLNGSPADCVDCGLHMAASYSKQYLKDNSKENAEVVLEELQQTFKEHFWAHYEHYMKVNA